MTARPSTPALTTYLFNYSSNLLYLTQRTTTGASSTYQSLEVRPSRIDKAGKKRECVHHVRFPGRPELGTLGTSQTVSRRRTCTMGLAVSSGPLLTGHRQARTTCPSLRLYPHRRIFRLGLGRAA